MTARMTDYSLAVWRQKNGEPDLPLPPKPRKKRDNQESRIQKAVIRWWAVMHRGFGLRPFSLYAVPNGAYCGPVGGSILKDEGLRTGACDLNLDVARGNWHGLRIEMKKPGGIVSDEQQAFLAEHLSQRYCARVCYSCDEAVGLITRYLAGEENL